MSNKEKILTLLKENECYVTFKKKDGTLRTMLCTLLTEKIPEKNESTRHWTPCDYTISAFDLEANGWRSFIIENVEDILIESKIVYKKEK